MSRIASVKSGNVVIQKGRELDWLLLFQTTLPDCPRTTPLQLEPPAPDLIFGEFKLGIEVTEYLLGQGKDGSHSRRLESVRRRIVLEAQSKYEKHVSHCLHVSVKWATLDCPTKREETDVSQALARLVACQTSSSGRLWRIGWEQFDELILRKYVAEVSIYRVGDIGQSCWSSAAAFWLWEAEKRVQVAMDAKEPKVSAYRKFCRELWLLIVADKSWLSSKFFPDQDFANAVFHSSFDRAFLLDESSATVYEFKIEDKRSVNSAR